jgi:type VII secretion integral membrane protein EccD
VRVTVTSGTRRVDLALPTGVCVADLVPELARCVGMLDTATAHRGFRVVTRDGRVLRTDLGLTAQGVEHGNVLTIAAGVDEEPRWAYDDVVDAMTDLVERDVEHWSPAARRRTMLWSAVVLLLLGAGGVLTRHGTHAAVTTSAALAAMLVTAAVLWSRVRGEAVAAVAAGSLGCVYAAVAGFCCSRDTWLSGAAVALAGGGMLTAGLVAALGMGTGRMLLMPAVVVGAVCSGIGLLMRTTTLDPALILTALLALIVVASSAFPGLALSATGAGRHARCDADAVSDREPCGIDLARLAADARLGREILVSASATTGVLIAVLAPVAVASGPVGFAIPVLGSAVVTLRTRRYRAGLDVLVGVISGVLGLVSTVAAMLWLDGGWRFPTALVVVVTGLVLLGRAMRPLDATGRPGRFGDRIETAALIALLPAVALALSIEAL